MPSKYDVLAVVRRCTPAKAPKCAPYCFRSCSRTDRLACSPDQGHSLENTADSCIASMPSRSLSTSIANMEEWKSGNWRKATSGRPGECGMVGVEGWRLFGGGTMYGSCRGGSFHELYRRTNQTAIRQTFSKNGLSPTTLPQRTSVFAARTHSLGVFGMPRKAQEWQLECTLSDPSCTRGTTCRRRHLSHAF